MTDTLPEGLIYIGDPMCSWCWGFAPVVKEVQKAFPELGLHIMVGGLRPDEAAQPLDGELRSYLQETWAEVARQTGQPFDMAFLQRDGFIYDTGPACRAIVAMRHEYPELAWPLFHWLQERFYAQGGDITTVDYALAFLRERGLEAEAWRQRILSDELMDETRAEYQQVRSLGVRSFPTLLLKREGEVHVAAPGTQSFERVRERISSLLA